ncbi:redox-sensing transcriptional repressor Rex [Effusibacillus lacus]|uniref:Redox-sensing transcriptional repressor Rex n=1 Tax=Effusibacillus lacus TaxID=1348429 RepID=A0A292YMS0_9BACL|nr:redox-sensing transcriptional repressor Rex [Effusibacillus lacus]TCS75336.1 redox-sensing transcriptional repressor [Effusibacillus lacus]GAX89770.1 redox-sensing transcriptional repressor Rex [Effusibacillus lacus]
MKTPKISEAVIRRLPVYLRYLHHLRDMNVTTVSSHELGQHLDMNPAQIRKDLAYFGEFGRKGIGYDVQYLIEKIKQILKLDRRLNVALVGAGNLGTALSNYNRYTNEKLKIVAIFDASQHKVGTKVGSLEVLPIEMLPKTVKELDIKMGIITVPATEAQKVADQMVQAGIKGILNFAPVILRVPLDVPIRNADVTTELESLAYYVD